MIEVVTTSSGQLVLHGLSDKDSALVSRLAHARARGLLEMLREGMLVPGSPSLGFWASLVTSFMKSFCAFSESDPLRIPEDVAALDSLLTQVPPMPGGEYLTREYLSEIWQELEEEILVALSRSGKDARSYLTATYPDWAQVGRIHFHLAENKGEGEGPFAFLATYSVRVPGKARIQHRPLGLALKEAVDQGHEQKLERLLAPVYQAVKASSLIRSLLSSKKLYRKALLSPGEAYEYIKDIPACEEAGIICKVPSWWEGKRPQKAKVNVIIGADKKRSHVGAFQLLNFEAAVAIGNNNLSPDQLEKLMAAGGPLVEFAGRWVEVDSEKIDKMLRVWDTAVRAAEDAAGGISFADAMRLLSGFGSSVVAEEANEAEGENIFEKEWQSFTVGPAFRDLLDRLRNPRTGRQVEAVLDKHLAGKLRPYQLQGLGWLNALAGLGLGGCLADDMGLGKTIQIIAFLLVQKHLQTPKVPSLLVVPTSLLGNWQSELERFAPGITYQVLHASAGLTIEQAKNSLTDVDVVITTFGIVRRQPWLQGIKWNAVIADEAQAIKNANTAQSRAVRALDGATKIAMTGTPVENNLIDLWSIFDFTCSGLLGNQPQFGRAIEAMQEAADYSPLKNLLQPYLLRRQKTDKKVINDLPDKIELLANCYLSQKQVLLYQAEVAELQAALSQSDGIAKKGAILKALIKLKQICNHPSQYLGNDSYAPALSGKFAKLSEICETVAAKQEKVLIFTQFRELTDILAHQLRLVFGSEGLVLHGGTPVKRRQQLVEQFQDPLGPAFFILSLKAGGTGLNLTAANHVIHFDRWWNPAVENQATDRAFRIGQKKKVLVHKFICKGTIEEKIDAMIRDKLALAEQIVSSSKEVALTELSNNEIMDLVRLDLHSLPLGVRHG